MLARRTLLLSAVAAALPSLGCGKRDSSASRPSSSARTTNGTIAPSEPVDPAFDGCARSCGSARAKDRAEAHVQPGASPGDAAYCVVSGAVFRINDATPHRQSRGKTLYFCCQACSAWFAQHEAEVLVKRGLA